jgi:hypothetical protein
MFVSCLTYRNLIVVALHKNCIPSESRHKEIGVYKNYGFINSMLQIFTFVLISLHMWKVSSITAKSLIITSDYLNLITRCKLRYFLSKCSYDTVTATIFYLENFQSNAYKIFEAHAVFLKRMQHKMKNPNETRVTKARTDKNYLLNLTMDFPALCCRGGNL